MAYTPAVGDMPAFTAEEIANAKAYFNQVGSLDQVIQEATAAGYTPEQVASLYAQSMPEQNVGYDQALSIFNEQAAKTPMTNPLQEFVVNNAPTDEQINENKSRGMIKQLTKLVSKMLLITWGQLIRELCYLNKVRSFHLSS